ncbi:MAG: phosphoribosyltransferase [Acidobacteriaceae bacterium]
MRFRDRVDAGRQLSSHLTSFSGRGAVLVLGLARGGVPVAFEVASTLRCPLDVFVVRKLGAPGQPEYGIGAVASGGIRLVNNDAVHDLRISPRQMEELIVQEERELARREELYRAGRPSLEIRNRTVIVVDDGVATGSSMRAAIAALRRQDPAQITVAIPIAARSVCQVLEKETDSIFCLATPPDLSSVGEWYQDFSQTTDEQVRELLSQAFKFRSFR